MSTSDPYRILRLLLQFVLVSLLASVRLQHPASLDFDQSRITFYSTKSLSEIHSILLSSIFIFITGAQSPYKILGGGSTPGSTLQQAGRLTIYLSLTSVFWSISWIGWQDKNVSHWTSNPWQSLFKKCPSYIACYLVAGRHFREYWTIKRKHGFLVVGWFGSSPTPYPLSLHQVFSPSQSSGLSAVELTAEIGGKGLGKEPNHTNARNPGLL